MRHQSKRKYADRKKLNRKYHSQKAYRKEQKRKTGWRARLDKFTDRLVNVFMICFLLTIPIFIVYMIFFDHNVYKDSIYGLWKSENHPTKEGAKEVSVIGILFKMEMSSLKMHASMILNASRMVPSTLKFTLRNACFQTSPLKTALTI